MISTHPSFATELAMSSFIYTSEIGHLKNPVASTRITAKTNKTELMQLCMDGCDAVGLV
jgi:hypothetical protein